MKQLLTILSIMLLVPADGLAKPLTSQPPGAKKYIKKQIQRKPVLRKYRYKGHVGEADTGYLAIRTLEGLKKEEKEKVKKLVEAENQDRKNIYAEVIKYNKLDTEKKKKIMIESFYHVYKNTSPKGNYFYENKTWQKKY